MARMLKWLGLATLSLALTGCVSQEKYNALKLDRDNLAEQLGTAKQDASTSKAQADSYKDQLDKLAASGQTGDALVANLTKQNQDLAAQYADIKAKYDDLVARPPQVTQVVQGSALPAPLTNALSEFASSNPDLVDFDAARGVVKFKSDVTFATGSAEVTDKAKNVIERFASILNSANANDYELTVVGHTDNAPVRNPATIAAGHKDNWYLSAHRAIAVARELVTHQVSPARLEIAGFADQRPIASNATEAGKAQNRRVEVLILPTKHSGPAVAAASGSSSHRTAPRTARPELNKDGVTSTDRGPVLNK
jgi:chemotaxis protein MotB